MTIPQEAITAAAGAIWDAHTNGPVPVDKGQWCNQLARAALEAAAAQIAAAERQRIIQLLETEAPRYALGPTALRHIAARLREEP